MEYRYSSNNILIIDQSYKVHPAHESQSEGMDRQWFQIYIFIDIRKRSFLQNISHYIYYHHLSPLYSLVCKSDNFNNTKITWFHFSFKRVLLFFFLVKSPYFSWEFYLGFWYFFNTKMNKINPSDNYLLFTINTILLLFMWILWNESDCVFILYIMVRSSSFSWGYGIVANVIWSIAKVLIILL